MVAGGKSRAIALIFSGRVASGGALALQPPCATRNTPEYTWNFSPKPYFFHLFGLSLSTFLDGFCSTVQGLLDWFEVDLGFIKLFFIQIDLRVMRVFVLYLTLSLSSCLFLDSCIASPARWECLESALNLVSRMSPCGAHDTHACCARSNDHLLYLLS